MISSTKAIVLRKRRMICSTFFMILLLFTVPATGEPPGAVSYPEIVKQAKQLAEAPFSQPGEQIPSFLLDLGYDQWRDIRFDEDKSLWRSGNLPFEIQFFHPGSFYNIPVTIHEIDNGSKRTVSFSRDQFTYGKNDFKDKLPEHLGYAGFRIHYPLNRQDYKDEVAVFLGASYLRAVGKEQQYGLSARGLAIDTGLKSGEEFPFFREFWLLKPEPEDTSLTIYALLDSPRYTGAYQFVIHPGESTLINVKTDLFRREPVEKLGIAPLTSMFFYGENINIRPVDDFRPEIHDSDGLLLSLNSGEWLFRPLSNPASLSIDAFQAPNLKGFGLLQRDMNFHHYQDLEARYHRRPSVWITPDGEWGNGHVELVQIPTDSEYNDNIVAFWVPGALPEKDPVTFSYAMEWHQTADSRHGGGKVLSSRTAYDEENNIRTFLIDFAGGKLDALSPEAYPGAVVSVGENARLVEQQVQRNPENGGWRLVFKIETDEGNPIEKVIPSKMPRVHLRAFLRQEQDILTETWDYVFHP